MIAIRSAVSIALVVFLALGTGCYDSGEPAPEGVPAAGVFHAQPTETDAMIAFERWRSTSTVDAPNPRSGHCAVWTGLRMIIWGGRQTGGSVTNDGAVYDPAGDTWTPMSPYGAPSPRAGHTIVWTGSQAIIWGGDTNTGSRYTPGIWANWDSGTGASENE